MATLRPRSTSATPPNELLVWRPEDWPVSEAEVAERAVLLEFGRAQMVKLLSRRHMQAAGEQWRKEAGMSRHEFWAHRRSAVAACFEANGYERCPTAPGTWCPRSDTRREGI